MKIHVTMSRRVHIPVYGLVYVALALRSCKPKWYGLEHAQLQTINVSSRDGV